MSFCIFFDIITFNVFFSEVRSKIIQRNFLVDVIEVTFNTSSKIPDIPFEGRYYRGYFGANYDYANSFMLRHKIEGPCWIKFKNMVPCTEFIFLPNYLTFKVKFEEEISFIVEESYPSFSFLSIHIEKDRQQLQALYLSKNK